MTLYSKSPLFRVLPLLAGCIAVFFACWMSLAPWPLPASVSPEAFSAERAHRHIAAVCTAPQPAGSLRNDEACRYIQDELARLGVETELIHIYDRTGEHQVSRRRAVLGRIRGTQPTKAFAMDAHFDSVAWGPGATDDWAGIATMLETARALKSSPPLRNDVIFVFADQEEFNMGGAKAFRNHPWFRDVGVMMGMETRGTCGPSLMFETSPQNGFILRELARAGVGPRANSIMYDFYDRMPFNSDFQHYKEDVAGINLAFIDGFDHYHTVLDNPENASLASIQHNGNYALGLARHLGGTDLTECHAPNVAFFNTLGGHLVVYPLSWGWPLAAAVALLFAAVLVCGFMSRGLRLGGTLVAAFVIPATMLVAAGPIVLISYLMFDRFRETALYQNNVLSVGMVALGLAVFMLALTLARRWSRPQELLAGALLWMFAALFALQVWLPGGTHLACIYIVSGSVALLALLFTTKDGQPSEPGLAWTILLTIPALMVLAPPLCIPFYAVTVMASVALLPVVLLLVSLAAPQMCLLARSTLVWMAAVLAVAGASLLGIGYAGCLPSPDSPRLNCLAYGVDFDASQAWWLSSTRHSDPWLERYLPKGTLREEAGPFLPHDRNKYLKAPAPMPPFEKPSLNVLEDKVQDGKRLMTCRLYSPRGAQRIWLRVVSDTTVHKAVVLGHELPGAEKNWDLTLEIPPREGVELRLETDPAAPLKISIREDSYELPKFPDFVPRPADTTAEPNRTLIRLPLSSEHTYSIATVDLGLPPSGNL